MTTAATTTTVQKKTSLLALLAWLWARFKHIFSHTQLHAY